jgi:hypothetical protein
MYTPYSPRAKTKKQSGHKSKISITERKARTKTKKLIGMFPCLAAKYKSIHQHALLSSSKH